VRPTPFELVFADLAAERFPAIAEALTHGGIAATDRDHFVLLEPVGRLLRDIVPDDAGADALEAHVLLLHHAFLHWAAGTPIGRIGEQLLAQAAAERTVTSRVPHAALYLQMPELRVWGTPTAGASEPLDGMFVAATTEPGGIAVLGIFGMRPDRPGFSAVGVEGRADADDPGSGEIEIAAAREDGSAPFGPTLAGGTKAGLYSLANPGELLLLTCRLLTLLTTNDVP
jgi:hypothetical protein